MHLRFHKIIKYRKVASSTLTRLVAHLRIFRLFIKGKFDAYVMWPLAKRVQNWIVDRSTAWDFTKHDFEKDFNGMACTKNFMQQHFLVFSCSVMIINIAVFLVLNVQWCVMDFDEMTFNSPLINSFLPCIFHHS